MKRISGALILSVMLANIALAKNTFVVPRPEIPVATDLKLSNYRAALITDQGRALVMRNDTLQWEIMSSDELMANHVLQRRSQLTTIPSVDEITHDAVEGIVIPAQLIPDDATITVREVLGLIQFSSNKGIFMDTPYNDTCTSTIDANNANIYLIHCVENAYQYAYQAHGASVALKRYNTFRVYATQGKQGNSSAAFHARIYDYTQFNPIIMYMNGGAAGSYRMDLDMKTNPRNPKGPTPYSPSYPVPIQSALLGETSVPSTAHYGAGRKATIDLAWKSHPREVNSTSAACIRTVMTGGSSDDVNSSDLSNVHWNENKENHYVTCELLAWKGHSLLLHKTPPIDDISPPNTHPIFNALIQDKVYLAIVEGKRRASFFSDTLNNRSYLYLAKGDEWTEIPLGLNDGENVLILSEAIYELIPAD